MGISSCDKVLLEVAQIVIREHSSAQEAHVARRRDFAAADIEMMEDIVPSSKTSATRSRTSSQRAGNMEEDDSTPPTLRPRQGVSASFISSALQKQRQKAAEIQIARCVIECNLAFNVVHTEAWRHMVKAIAQVGPCDDWYGLDYKRLHTTMLDEERDRIEVQLEPIKTSWVMYGCSIIFDMLVEGGSALRVSLSFNISKPPCLKLELKMWYRLSQIMHPTVKEWEK
ncbi:hypothetical protein KP509_34G047800 [Ceratopteris richardii]|uniref:Uncharacterized protein n=1 Tax=Ceratopteris richardii TaxID=49495 RepID=A0A8T2QL63_CERRI|nr:hypothetical protein KP509_34G047800 [Ceratopteris richardii]